MSSFFRNRINVWRRYLQIVSCNPQLFIRKPRVFTNLAVGYCALYRNKRVKLATFLTRNEYKTVRLWRFLFVLVWRANPRDLGAVSRAQVMITAAGSLAYILRIRPCPLWRTVALTPSIKLECLSLYLPCLFAEPTWYYFCSLSNCFVIMRPIWFPLRTGLDNYFYSHALVDIFWSDAWPLGRAKVVRKWILCFEVFLKLLHLRPGS